MARVKTVEKAQQRYETKPVIDPETGQQKQTPVMRNGVQRVTKRGKPITMGVTERDLTRPKPNYRCDYPGCDIDGGEIKPGTAYQYMDVKTGPSSSRRYTRHKVHPAWHSWEYSSSLSAQLDRISYDFDQTVDSAEDPDEVRDALNTAAEAIREIAEEKKTSASNIEDGFGGANEKSEELAEIGESLDDWASEVENADVPDMVECETCSGTGREEDEDGDSTEEDCAECGGTGEDVDAWRDQVRDEVTIVGEVPV